MEFSVRFTESGWRTIAVFLIVGSLALLFMDPIIGVVAVGIAFTVLYSYLHLRRELSRLQGGLRFSPSSVSSSTTVGRAVSENIKVESSLGGVVTLGCGLEDAQLDNVEVLHGVNSVNYVFKPKLSGEVSSASLVASLTGYLGLCEGSVDVGFAQGFKVYPRVVEVIAEAVEFLASSDVFGSGAQILRLRGGGAEYAESRPYVAGDSLKNLDWKATARFGSLMAKEFYLEGGAEIAVVYDLVAPDAVARDEVAASFLELVLMYARMDYAVDMHVVEGSKAVFSGERLAPQVAVSVGLRSVLEAVEVEPQVVYDVLDPGASGVFRRVLEMPDPWAGFGGREIVGAEYVYVDLLSGRDVEGMYVSVVSALGDPAPLFGLARYAVGRGWSVSVLQPARPWLSAPGLEGAVEGWSRYGRLYSRLERDGVNVCSSVAEVMRNLEGNSVVGAQIRG